ncbi:MAG: hypothetical protein LBU82_02625 [Treponema sp.]|jgi:hypothetical protein|nr:hypothetical protein [Treponema sp.]
MANAKIANKRNSKVKFSMKMPDWFIEELDVEQQKILINKLRTKPDNFRPLNAEDLKKLAINSDSKGMQKHS